MRSRKRDKAGSSDKSWKKHELLERVAWAQLYAYHVTHPRERHLIIDMHAGNGEGVSLPQLDMFCNRPSTTTVQIAMKLRMAIGNCDVILCEKDKQRRQRLVEHFSSARILPDHAEIPSIIQPYHHWALIFNDPNGYGEHGIDTMQKIAAILKVDWLIVFNQGAFDRLYGMEEIPHRPDPPHVARVRAAKTKYAWMREHLAWADRLNARHMAQYPRINASDGFRYRLFVLSHTLSDVVHRPPWEILR
jgi:hypothetical protein